jgi:hypothetical protein
MKTTGLYASSLLVLVLISQSGCRTPPASPYASIPLPAREWYETRSPDDTKQDEPRLIALIRQARSGPPNLMLMRQFVSMASRPDGMQNHYSTGYLGLLFSDGYPIFEKPPFTRSGQSRLDWFHAVVDSLDAAQDREDLKYALLKVMDILKIREMKLEIPEIGVLCEMERTPNENGETAGGLIWSWEDRSVRQWKRDMPQIISACQKWLRDDVDAKYGVEKRTTAPTVPSEAAASDGQ